MNKKITMKSKLRPDMFAANYLYTEEYDQHFKLCDYAPANLSEEAYWKDLRKYDREIVDVPHDFYDIALAGIRGLKEDEAPDEEGSEALPGLAPFLEEEMDLWTAKELQNSIDGTKASGTRLSKPKKHYVGRQSTSETEFSSLSRTAKNGSKSHTKSTLPTCGGLTQNLSSGISSASEKERRGSLWPHLLIYSLGLAVLPVLLTSGLSRGIARTGFRPPWASTSSITTGTTRLLVTYLPSISQMRWSTSQATAVDSIPLLVRL